jgi:hypothetical protein
VEKRGRKWSEIHDEGTSLEARGFSLMQIKDWRAREYDAGRPAGLEDFFLAHNLCITCQCRGLIMLGPDEDGNWLWDLCEICGGTGTPRAGNDSGLARIDPHENPES